MRPDTKCLQHLVSSVQQLMRLRDMFRHLSPKLMPIPSDVQTVWRVCVSRAE